MKKILAALLFTVLFFAVGCGSSDPYDDADSGDSGNSNTQGLLGGECYPNGNCSAGLVCDKDKNICIKKEQGDTGDTTPADTGDTSDSGDTGDTDSGDVSDSGTPADFWKTCEGIISCMQGCLDDDSECKNSCYSKGNDDGQLAYRRWEECFSDSCAEDPTPECSAEKCAEWDEKCNVAAAFEYEVSYPAPYGNAEFAGSFSFILDDRFPRADSSSENEIVFGGFAEGKVASMSISSSGTMISFVKYAKDKRDGEVLEVYQAMFDVSSMTPMNPVSILRIKIGAVNSGKHTVGVTNDDDARFVVAEIDSKYVIQCVHAFGTGSFEIEDYNTAVGSNGKLKFKDGKAELFSPQNVPELDGDAREFLGVSACSLIQ